MRALMIGVAGFLVACSTASGASPKTTYSGFDQAAVVTIDPHGNACRGMVCTGIGAQWQEVKPEYVLLAIKVFNDTVGITGAELNIDGETVELTEARSFTQFDSNEFYDLTGIIARGSTQDFVAPIALIDQILSAERVWLRVTTNKGQLEDAVIDGGKDSKAFNALKRFREQVSALTS